ncbi:AraC family transcriptional regulator, partial [Streptomyces sp. NPDC001478]
MSTPHRVVIAVFPAVDLLDVSGPAEVQLREAGEELPGEFQEGLGPLVEIGAEPAPVG